MAKCHACGKTGHVAPVCRSTAKKPGNHKSHHRKKQAGSSNFVGGDGSAEASAELDTFALTCNVGGSAARPIIVDLEVSGKKLLMELDTGATVTIISEST